MPPSLLRRCCHKRSLVVKTSLALVNKYLHPAFGRGQETSTDQLG